MRNPNIVTILALVEQRLSMYAQNWETEATFVFSRGGQRTIHRSEFVCTQVGGGPRVIRQLRSFRFKHGPARFTH